MAERSIDAMMRFERLS